MLGRGDRNEMRAVVALHPKTGEMKYQKRQSKEDTEWIIEESYGASSEKQWKRMIIIWRTFFLMVVASISSPSTITLSKEELDEFYDFMMGEDVMGRDPPAWR